jgi:hypothetical protein
MTSMVLGDSTLESLTPSVNAPEIIILWRRVDYISDKTRVEI